MSTLQIVKLFMKYLSGPKRARTKKEDLRKVQSLSEIEQNTRTAINDHLDKLRKEKYEGIEAIEKKEKTAREEIEAEKKRQERKDIEDAKERQEIMDREHKRELAEINERQEQKDRELRREQKLIEDLQFEQQRNQRLAIMPPPQQQYIMPQQGQPQGQAQYQAPQGQAPQAPPTAPPLPNLGDQTPLKTKEQYEEEKKQKQKDIETLKLAGYTDKFIKKMSRKDLQKKPVKIFRRL